MKTKVLFAAMVALVFIATGCEKEPEDTTLSQRVEIVDGNVVYTLKSNKYSRKMCVVFGYGYYDRVWEEWSYSSFKEAREVYLLMRSDFKYEDEPNEVLTKLENLQNSKLVAIEFNRDFYMDKYGNSTAQEVKDEIQAIIDRGEILGMPLPEKISQQVEIVDGNVVYTLKRNNYSRKMCVVFGDGYYHYVWEEWSYSSYNKAREAYLSVRDQFEYEDEPNEVLTKLENLQDSKLVTIEFSHDFYLQKYGDSTAQKVKDEIQAIINRGEILGMPLPNN